MGDIKSPNTVQEYKKLQLQVQFKPIYSRDYFYCYSLQFTLLPQLQPPVRQYQLKAELEVNHTCSQSCSTNHKSKNKKKCCNNYILNASKLQFQKL